MYTRGQYCKIHCPVLEVLNVLIRAERSEARNNRADISLRVTMYVCMLSRFRNVIIVSI